MNGDNFDDTSKPTFSKDDEPHFVADPTAMMDPQQKRLYMETVARGKATSVIPSNEFTVSFPEGSVVTPLYLCPKCQKKSHYDPKEFHGLCPACWDSLHKQEKCDLSRIPWVCCAGRKNGCDSWTCRPGLYEDHSGYCRSCWLKLTPEQRAILKGEEPLPTQETRIVHLPAVPSLWKVFGVSILATVIAIAACSVVGYALVFHMCR